MTMLLLFSTISQVYCTRTLCIYRSHFGNYGMSVIQFIIQNDENFNMVKMTNKKVIHAYSGRHKSTARERKTHSWYNSCQEYLSFIINFYHDRFSANKFWMCARECISSSGVASDLMQNIYYEFVSAHFLQHQSSLLTLLKLHHFTVTWSKNSNLTNFFSNFIQGFALMEARTFGSRCYIFKRRNNKKPLQIWAKWAKCQQITEQIVKTNHRKRKRKHNSMKYLT